jgi:hypothetical protein
MLSEIGLNTESGCAVAALCFGCSEPRPVVLRSETLRRILAGMMRIYGFSGGFWLGPVLLGLFLIAVGVAIWIDPRLLACSVAVLLITSGGVLVASGLQMRTRVSYRRFDRVEFGPDDEP